MWRNSLGLVSFLCTLAVANGLAHAADPALNELAGLPVTAMFSSSGAPGMVVALVRGSESLVGGLGETAKGNGQEPTGRSVFRLGSISKVMTGELLAALTVEGKLRLSEPLQRFAPQGKMVPTLDGRAITLLDLATHSAGLPRDIGPAPEGQTFLTWPTEQERWNYISSAKLLWPPATTAAYSNVGYQLLGDAMSAAAGESYSALLLNRLTAPLGMTDTTVRPSEEQCARLMTGSGLSWAHALHRCQPIGSKWWRLFDGRRHGQMATSSCHRSRCERARPIDRARRVPPTCRDACRHRLR